MIFVILEVLLSSCSTNDDQVPIVLIHGILADNTIMNGLKSKLEHMSPNRKVINLEILFGVISSVFGSHERYIKMAALTIQKYAQNASCIDIIGHSQGGFVSRAYIQLYSSIKGFPKVRKFFSLAGVMAGYFSETGIGDIILGKSIMSSITWAPFIYACFPRFAIVPIMMWKDPMRLDQYQASGNILCRINGECVNSQMEQVSGQLVKVGEGRHNIIDLDAFYTFYSTIDQVISPRESSIFDFYRDGSTTEIQDFKTTELYQQDRFGMKTLNEAGRWTKFVLKSFYHDDFELYRVDEFFKYCLEPLISTGNAPNCNGL